MHVCTHETLFCCHVHHGLHKLHSRILVCTSTRVFPHILHVSLACTLAWNIYTQVIYSHACVLTTTSRRAYLIGLGPMILIVLHFQIIYSELQRYTDDHIYSNTLVYLERFMNLERGCFVKQYRYCS